MLFRSHKPDNVSPMLKVSNLTHKVSLETDTLTILQGVSLEINRGESVAIVGRSGSGKTTLLGLLAGLDTPSDGTVELDGSVISKLSEDERAKLRSRRVGFVFQSFQLLPALTALENVMLPLELGGFDSPKAKAKELLERVGLGERLSHTPRQLSGGEQQREQPQGSSDGGHDHRPQPCAGRPHTGFGNGDPVLDQFIQEIGRASCRERV